LRKISRVILILMILLGMFLPGLALGANDTVYVVTINGDIDKALITVVENAFQDAKELSAKRILVEIDTYGGYIDSAIQIKDIIMASPIPVTCCVANKAISAGSLIALAGNELLMAPGSVIGAAEPRIGNEPADEKALSMWAAELSSTAESRGKNGEIAAAMADSSIVIEDLTEEDKLLTLTDTEAITQGIAEGSYLSREDALTLYGLEDANIVVNQPTIQEKMGRFLTNPVVAPILLTVGIVGLLLEIITAGFGAFGVLGILGILLYFGGGVMAGYAGWIAALLFIGGLVLIALEIFVVPGFGITGIAGIAALIGGIFSVSPSWEQAILSMTIAIVATVAVIAWSLKYKKTRKLWSRLILWGKEDKASGYVAPQAGLENLLGAKGTSVTPLRPAGTAIIHEKRVDVVTQGEFINTNVAIEVIEVEGMRVVVKALLEIETE